MWTQSLRKNTTAVSCFIYMYGRNQLIKIRHTWLILVTEDPMVYGLDLEILTWLDVPWNIPSPTNFRSCPMFAKYHQSVGIGTKYLADVSHSGFLGTRALSWTTRLIIIIMPCRRFPRWRISGLVHKFTWYCSAISYSDESYTGASV